MALYGRLFIGALTFVPKKQFSRAVRRFAHVRSATAIRRFAERYDVNLDEAEKPIDAYVHLVDFFTRRLKPGARPIDPDPNTVVSPADAKLDAGGIIHKGELLQAKGRGYTVGALLAEDSQAKRFEGGSYLTLYLSPKDYHRVHSPVTGKIVGHTYVPGMLWPVNPHAVANVDSLFAVNERVITHIESERFGRVDVVMVGATCVGHIKLAYDETVATNVGATEIFRRVYDPPLPIERGAELGVFEMGSTVILLLEDKVKLDPIELGKMVKVGERLGVLAAVTAPQPA